MPAKPKTSVVPPGGFHYIEQINGRELKLESTSVESVQELLLRYRLNNGLPVGNPQQDVVDYICNNWPHFCTDATEPYLTPANPMPREAHLSRRVSDWTVKLWELGAKNEISAQEADRRASICAACPLNADYHGGACGPCVESLERLGFIWLRSRATRFDDKLGGCRACGQFNKLGVQAGKLPDMSDEDRAALDPKCWRR